jgi:hypothetical protein
VDWCLALALAGDPDAGPLRSRLGDEILAGGNSDGSFGGFDQPLSTALAVLALAATGYGGRRILAAQLRLVQWLERPAPWPAATPFYSTFLGGAAPEATAPEGHLAVAGQLHELSLYEDSHQVIFASLAQLALEVASEGAEPEEDPPAASAHRRYRCGREEYLARHALPHYAPALADGSVGT